MSLKNEHIMNLVNFQKGPHYILKLSRNNRCPLIFGKVKTFITSFHSYFLLCLKLKAKMLVQLCFLGKHISGISFNPIYSFNPIAGGYHNPEFWMKKGLSDTWYEKNEIIFLVDVSLWKKGFILLTITTNKHWEPCFIEIVLSAYNYIFQHSTESEFQLIAIKTCSEFNWQWSILGKPFYHWLWGYFHYWKLSVYLCSILCENSLL